MKKKFGKGTIEVERVYSGGGQGYDSSGRYYGTGLPVYAVTYEDDERDRWSGEKGREITVQVRASSISEAIESAGDEITRRLGIPRSEWKNKSTRRNQTRAREGRKHRGIYHEFDINEGDYVIRSHHRGGFVVDRVGRGGTHTTIGPTKGYSTAREALMEAARDSHIQGNQYGAVFLSDGDDVTQIGHIENGRFRGGGSDSIADVERFVVRKLSRSQPRESRRERSGVPRSRRHSRVREGGPISLRQVLEFLGPYMEHESLDAPKESARIARILNGAHGSRGVDNALEEVDKIIGGHGIEAIRGESHRGGYYGDIVGLYVNMGDTYNATVVYDTETGKFELTTWGDWVEQHQDEYEII